MIQRRIRVSGRVQGVGFRASTARVSLKFKNLRGFVRNLPDGRVEAVFLGESHEVEEMIAWCRTGPPAARVTSLELIEEDVDESLGIFDVSD